MYVGTFDIRVMSWEESIGASESMSVSLFFEVRRRRVGLAELSKMGQIDFALSYYVVECYREEKLSS